MSFQTCSMKGKKMKSFGTMHKLLSWIAIHLVIFAISANLVQGAEDRPNILWITSEDNGIAWCSCYGGTNAKTPNIDQLAGEGFLYTHCFDNAAVCAPTRSTWITGILAVSNGTQPMRSRNKIPENIRYYPDLLREAGYFVSNHRKTDFNIGGRPDDSCWDSAEGANAWRKRKEGQPFFSVVNIGSSHEGRAQTTTEKLLKAKLDTSHIELYSYHPDLPIIKKNYALYAQRIQGMDKTVSKILDELKRDGLYEDTIIIYCSDHGGVMPRSKRFLYSSGIHCPLVIRIPEKYKELYPAERPGMKVDRLVSFVDMPKTWLSLAGAEIPSSFQGTVFLGKGMEPEPRYHFGFRERADERLDCVRMMRDKRFAYYKNYMPYAPAGQYLGVMYKFPAMLAWEEHHEQGKTDEITGRFFRPRVSEELYDAEEDFDNVHNLIGDAQYKEKVHELSSALRRKQLEVFDSGLLPEKMRERRAAAHNITIYEMVRDPELYPLEAYLDAADRALDRDSKHLQKMTEALCEKDAGLRWWAVVGLLLLEERATPALDALTDTLNDDEHEIRMMAAWSLIKLGEVDRGLACLENLLFQENCDNVGMLHNVLDWIGEPAFPLVKKYIDEGGSMKGQYGSVSILGRIAIRHEL
jgi:N-sulfoglucosamine sulfohydrolase